MKLTIETPTFGPFKLIFARPFDLATEVTKIRFRGRTVEIGFQFKRRSEKLDWRLFDFVCSPPGRDHISRELEEEIRRVGKREILAWLDTHRASLHQRQRSEIIAELPAFRANVRRLLRELNHTVGRPLVEQEMVCEATRSDGARSPHGRLWAELIPATMTLRKIIDSARPETFQQMQSEIDRAKKELERGAVATA